MGSKKVFIILPKDGDLIEDIEAIFDNFEEASAFTKRFKENSNFSIVEYILNPEYHSNKEQSPYWITFLDQEQEPQEVDLADFEGLIENARHNKNWVDYYGEGNKSFKLNLCLFATSVEDAIAIGKKKRDDFVATGVL